MLSNNDKDSNSMASIIDGSTNKFSINGLDPGTATPTTLTQLGFKSGGAIKSVNITAVPNGGDPDGYYQAGDNIPDLDGGASDFDVPLNLKYSLFKIELISMIWGLEEDITNFEDLVAPSWFLDTNALSDNFTIRFFNNYTDLEKFVVNDLNNPVTQLNGYTGWVNENYNGRPVPYTYVSTTYYNNLGTPIDFIDYGNETKVDVVINNPNHSGNTRYTISLFHLPNDVPTNSYSYLNNTIANTPISNNDFDGVDTDGYFLEGGSYGTYTGYEGINGERIDISDIDIVDLGGDDILISFRTNPNAQYFDYFDNQSDDDRRLVVFVSVQDWNNQEEFKRGYSIYGRI